VHLVVEELIVVSDTASKDPSTDRSGPTLRDVFAEYADIWSVSYLKIVSDEVLEIQSVVKKWTDEDALNLVVTCGGTGFAIRDVTPEVRFRKRTLM
jgi:gephyrin